jgi:hypothetical protein
MPPTLIGAPVAGVPPPEPQAGLSAAIAAPESIVAASAADANIANFLIAVLLPLILVS